MGLDAYTHQKHSKLPVLDVGDFMSASFIIGASDKSGRDMFVKPFPTFSVVQFHPAGAEKHGCQMW